MREKLRALWRWLKNFLRLLLNWRFLICFGLAWLITNGWSYLLLAIGLLTKTPWMIGVSGAYLTFLWLPISPEKAVTCAIAVFLVGILFPKHRDAMKEQVEKLWKHRKRKKKKEQQKEQEEQD